MTEAECILKLQDTAIECDREKKEAKKHHYSVNVEDPQLVFVVHTWFLCSVLFCLFCISCDYDCRVWCMFCFVFCVRARERVSECILYAFRSFSRILCCCYFLLNCAFDSSALFSLFLLLVRFACFLASATTHSIDSRCYILFVVCCFPISVPVDISSLVVYFFYFW